MSLPSYLNVVRSAQAETLGLQNRRHAAVFRPRLSYEAPSVAASERIPADDDPCNLDGAVPVAKVAHPLLEEVALDAHEEVATRVNEPE
jgi:hypothetical protein